MNSFLVGLEIVNAQVRNLEAPACDALDSDGVFAGDAVSAIHPGVHGWLGDAQRLSTSLLRSAKMLDQSANGCVRIHAQALN